MTVIYTYLYGHDGYLTWIVNGEFDVAHYFPSDCFWIVPNTILE